MVWSVPLRVCTVAPVPRRSHGRARVTIYNMIQQRSTVVALVCALAVTYAAPLFQTLAPLDCNGGLHVGVGTPAEVNVNLATAKLALNKAAEGIISRAQCAW